MPLLIFTKYASYSLLSLPTLTDTGSSSPASDDRAKMPCSRLANFCVSGVGAVDVLDCELEEGGAGGWAAGKGGCDFL
jgi:hypothetical protein